MSIEELPAGLHVLENRDLHEASPKADRVRDLLGGRSGACRGDRSVGFEDLTAMLGDHHRPPSDAPEPERRLASEVRAICVHDPADGYGTRSSSIINVSSDPGRRPRVHYTDGAPCEAPWRAVGEPW